jgi:hypothetical protein
MPNHMPKLRTIMQQGGAPMKSVPVVTARTIIGVALVLGLLIGGASALESVIVEIGKKATLIGDGQAVEVEVEVTCARGREVLEAFVYVVQDSNQSQFAGIPVKCNNKPRESIITVSAFPESSFHQGEAVATAYILLIDPATGTTEADGDTRTIDIR